MLTKQLKFQVTILYRNNLLSYMVSGIPIEYRSIWLTDGTLRDTAQSAGAEEYTDCISAEE